MKKLKCRTYLYLILAICVLAFLLKMATGGALAWSPETRLTENPAWDRVPTVTQTRDGIMWVAWASDTYPYFQFDIYYKNSFDHGLTWSSTHRFTCDLGTDDTPYILQTRNDNIWIVWASDRLGNLELFCKRSSDHGSTWDISPQQLTSSVYDDSFPSLTQNIDGTIWLVWHRNIAGNHDVFFKTSSNYGLTWSNATRLTTDPSDDLRPSIAHTHNGTIWVVWASDRTGDYEIFAKTTSDNGSNWSDIERLTTDDERDITPAVLQAVDGTLWVFWASERSSANPNIFFKTSSDYGLNWSDATELDGMSSYDDQNPAVTNTDERKIWVVWHSLRTKDYEIYYVISDEITSIHDVAVTEIIPWIPPDRIIRSASRGTIIYVNVTAENQGTFEEDFNVTAYADRITNDVHIDLGTENIVLTNGSATTVTFVWNTTQTPPGSYFISANATIVSGEYDTEDNVLLRGAYIGGIYNPLKGQHTSMFATLVSVASAILIAATIGFITLLFLRLLMSTKPHRTDARSKDHDIKKRDYK